jgi:hypothetical protein
LTGLPYTTSRIADFTFNSQSKQDLTAELDLTHQRYCGIDPQDSERRSVGRRHPGRNSKGRIRSFHRKLQIRDLLFEKRIFIDGTKSYRKIGKISFSERISLPHRSTIHENRSFLKERRSE